MDSDELQAATDLVEKLGHLGYTRGILVRMANARQLYQIRCEMPTCYCPKGRDHFDEKDQPMPKWALNADHYPRLEMDGGKRTPDNIRLAHVKCNSEDFAWRKRIRTMLELGMSLNEIAAKLNADRKVSAPHGTNQWSAATVRQAFVS